MSGAGQGPVRPFSLLVKPSSADCNLRCRYCFYLDRCGLYPDTKRHRMSDAVLERMIGSFLALNQPQNAFGWQGGEPTLMGLPFFERVVELQQKHGRSGALISNGLQTNGTLLDDAFARHLAKYKFLVGISVDGPAELHDQSRLTIDGRGSHADVMRGMACLKRNAVEFNVLTLVNAANVGHAERVYRYLCDLGVFYHQYVECVEFDGQGRLLPYAVTGAQWGEFLCRIYDLWIAGDTRRVSVRLFDSILTMMVDGVANVCQMGRDCRQYLVVEHNGDVYPCDFFVEKELKLGNIMEAEWADLQASPLYAAFGRRKVEWNEACAQCAYLRFCAGDCPKNRGPGRRDPRRLSHLCEGWKRFHAHTADGFARIAGEIRRERQAAAVRVRSEHAAAVGAGRQVGRNDPCPCGSGRKFKKCCGR